MHHKKRIGILYGTFNTTVGIDLNVILLWRLNVDKYCHFANDVAILTNCTI